MSRLRARRRRARAVLRGEDLATLAQRTTENARRCFGQRIDRAL